MPIQSYNEWLEGLNNQFRLGTSDEFGAQTAYGWDRNANYQMDPDELQALLDGTAQGHQYKMAGQRFTPQIAAQTGIARTDDGKFFDLKDIAGGLVSLAGPLAQTAGLGLGIGSGLHFLTGGAMGLSPAAFSAGLADFANAGNLAGGAASAGAGAGAAGGAAAGGGAMMPAAVPPVDPTFGGALAEIAPGVWANVGNYAAFGGVGLAAGAGGTGAGVGGGVGGGLGGGGAGGGLGGLGKVMSNPSLLGAGLGALAGGMGGGTQPAGSITVEEGIPDWLMPYVKPQLDKYSAAVQNYNTDPYGVMPAAMQEFMKTVQGSYLDPSTNKWLEEYYKLGAERVKGTVSPSFGHMQAFGNHSGYNEALSRGLSDLAVGLYGGNYQKERDRQYGMTAAAPQFLAQSSAQAFTPYTQYLNTVGNLGKKKEQPYFDNPMGNVLGGAMMGYGLGNIFK